MERAEVNGVTLEYAVVGAGEPVLCIHGAFVADAFQPLVAEPSLTSRYRLITYHRRGYVNSSRTPDPVSIAQQAADCRALLACLDVAQVHVVGHSLGGAVALQLALDTPAVVHSLALLEPALMIGAGAEPYRESLARSKQRFHEAGAAVVVDEFLQARWPGYRDHLDHVLPGAFFQAVADAGTPFESELPALLASLPHADGFVLPGATHFLQVENPRGMAEGLAAFFARHPIATRSPDTPDQVRLHRTRSQPPTARRQ